MLPAREHRGRERCCTCREIDGGHLCPVACEEAVIAAAIFAMTFFPRRRETVDRGHFLAVIGLTLLSAAIATFWR